MRDRDEMTKKIWKENAQEVMEFLETHEMKKRFQTERIAKSLQIMIKNKW